MENKPTILLIYTGGTIGMIRDFETGALQNFDFTRLLEHIPELQLLDCQIETLSFDTPIDSSNMNPSHWVTLANMIATNYDRCDGFVVLHGSDTMSYTASAMSFMLENLQKPVIFTGSQLPVGDLRTDAKENLITSIQIAAACDGNKPMVREVGLYFEYKLYRGNRTTKINAEHFEAFASLNYPPIAESGVHLNFDRSKLWRETTTEPLIVRTQMEQRIALIKLFPGINQGIFNVLLAAKDLKGLVLETYGAGNATTEAWFLEAIEGFIGCGVPVINVTQCSGGSVSMGDYSTSVGLKKLGVISGGDMTTEAALCKLMYLLGQDLSHKEFKAAYERSLRGELS